MYLYNDHNFKNNASVTLKNKQMYKTIWLFVSSSVLKDWTISLAFHFFPSTIKSTLFFRRHVLYLQGYFNYWADNKTNNSPVTNDNSWNKKFIRTDRILNTIPDISRQSYKSPISVYTHSSHTITYLNLTIHIYKMKTVQRTSGCCRLDLSDVNTSRNVWLCANVISDRQT